MCGEARWAAKLDARRERAERAEVMCRHYAALRVLRQLNDERLRWLLLNWVLLGELPDVEAA